MFYRLSLITTILVSAISVSAYAENANFSGNCHTAGGGSKVCVFEYNGTQAQYVLPGDLVTPDSTMTLYVNTVTHADKEGHRVPICDPNTAAAKTVLTGDKTNASVHSDVASESAIKAVFKPGNIWCAGAMVNFMDKGKPVSCSLWHWGSSFKAGYLQPPCNRLVYKAGSHSCSFEKIACLTKPQLKSIFHPTDTGSAH